MRDIVLVWALFRRIHISNGLNLIPTLTFTRLSRGRLDTLGTTSEAPQGELAVKDEKIGYEFLQPLKALGED